MKKNIMYKILFFILLISHALNDMPEYNYYVKDFDQKLDWRKMTLDEKIGQMIMVRVSGKFYNNPGYKYDNRSTKRT